MRRRAKQGFAYIPSSHWLTGVPSHPPIQCTVIPEEELYEKHPLKWPFSQPRRREGFSAGLYVPGGSKDGW
jgi:hypothetical protein